MYVTGTSLLRVFDALFYLGVVRTRREFSLRLLGRGADYLRDHARRVAGTARVAPITARYLRARLVFLARHVPAGIASEVRSVIDRLDRDAAVAAMLAR